MTQYHQLDSFNKVNINCNNKITERVKEYKLLGIILDEHFELHFHVNKILEDGYSTLRTLKTIKTLYTILSMETTLRVINIIKVRLLPHFIQNITTISKNRMEKLLQSCAGFVKCKYGCKNDVIDLKWLLLEERIDTSILKLV